MQKVYTMYVCNFLRLTGFQLNLIYTVYNPELTEMLLFILCEYINLVSHKVNDTFTCLNTSTSNIINIDQNV